MSIAAATNRVTLPAQTFSQEHAGSAVNDAIPVGGMETWRREAIRKVIEFGNLQPGWDSHGSLSPNRSVRAAAIDVLLEVPGELFPAPRVVPMSGGGYHFEWSMGDRELEISVESDCRIEVLQVEHGMPIEDDSVKDLPAFFSWLAAR